jgi:hypothetical protein
MNSIRTQFVIRVSNPQLGCSGPPPNAFPSSKSAEVGTHLLLPLWGSSKLSWGSTPTLVAGHVLNLTLVSRFCRGWLCHIQVAPEPLKRAFLPWHEARGSRGQPGLMHPVKKQVGRWWILLLPEEEQYTWVLDRLTGGPKMDLHWETRGPKAEALPTLRNGSTLMWRIPVLTNPHNKVPGHDGNISFQN